jgi:hypothetical protein
MFTLKSDNRIKFTTVAIYAIGFVLCFGLALVGCNSRLSASSVEIRIDGENAHSIERAVGAEVTLAAAIINGDSKTRDAVLVWEILEANIDTAVAADNDIKASIAPNGSECIVNVGMSVGKIIVAVHIEGANDKKADIEILIHDKALQSIDIGNTPTIENYYRGSII